MFFMSTIFMGLGAIVLIISVNTCVEAGLFAGIIPGIVGALFFCVGCHLFLTELNIRRNRTVIIAKGTKHLGKIIDYEDDTSLYVNGVPLAFVVVEYAPKGEVITGLFKTNSTNPSKWPIGSTVYIYEYKGQYAWDRKLLSKPYSN